jgi:hypothetical protein
MTKVCKICLLLILQAWCSGFVTDKLIAQTEVLEKKYSFHFSNVPLESVIDSLRHTVNYGFSYNPDEFPKDQRITIIFTNEKLATILDTLLSPHGYSYKIVGNNIVIIPKIQNREIQGPDAMEEIDTLKGMRLTGQIIDRKSRKPVEYASIYIRSKNIGTVSNNDGNFIIKLPKINISDSIYFSCIGYKMTARQISDLQSGEHVIPMELINFQLKEVNVKPIKPEDVIKKAVERIPKNYSTIPLMLAAFYRETIQQNNQYVALSEAILHIYKASYDSYLNDQVTIFRGRKSHFEKQMDTVVFKFQGGIYTSLMLDIAKNPSNFISDEYLGFYDFILDDIIIVGGRSTYVIAFDQKDNIAYPLFKGKLYIDIDSYALVRADFMISPKGLENAADILVRKSPRKLKVKPTFSSFVVNYVNRNSTWYLNYIREEVEFRIRKKFSFYGTTFRSRAEMVITQTDSTGVKRLKSNTTVRSNDIFVEKIGTYDPEFWGGFNIIQPDESLEQALQKIKGSFVKSPKRP